MRYYFNLKNGAAFHDAEGGEYADMDAVKEEALKCSVDMLKGVHSESIWSGEPWLLWVSDQPNGSGNTLLTLTFSARGPAQPVSLDRITWRVGQRVARKDSKELGTVVEQDSRVKVKWDDGKTSYYRHGHEANIELTVTV